MANAMRYGAQALRRSAYVGITPGSASARRATVETFATRVVRWLEIGGYLRAAAGPSERLLRHLKFRAGLAVNNPYASFVPAGFPRVPIIQSHNGEVTP
jgi:hypothetical protein